VPVLNALVSNVSGQLRALKIIDLGIIIVSVRH